MVTGQLPFKGPTAAEVASKRLTKSPIPPKKWNPKLSRNLNNLILRMMARSRDHRYANPAQLIKSIRHLRQGGRISAPPKPHSKWVALAAVILVAIMALFILFTGGSKVIEDRKIEAERTDRQGLNKTKYKDYKGAMAYFDRSIELNPNYASAYNNRGDVKHKLGDNKGAVADYDKALQLDPNFVEAYISRGFAKFMLGNYEGAIGDYDKAISINPNDAETYRIRSEAKYKLGDYGGAIDDCNKAIKLEPNYASAYGARGIVKYKLANYKDAIADYEKAIELSPSLKSGIQPLIDYAKAEINK
ncbi:tetratricopeptide repeat protein [Candidatus Peregrinibacteria bacterium]|nr:tetratricopeptide repeat protein [Candidatus Peregrinibacteria bacterium]